MAAFKVAWSVGEKIAAGTFGPVAERHERPLNGKPTNKLPGNDSSWSSTCRPFCTAMPGVSAFSGIKSASSP
jgi:hypothetical protein